MLVVSFIVPGCFEKEETFDEEKLVLIMTDMLTADELLAKFQTTEQERYKKFLKSEILAIHDIKESTLDSVMIELQSDLKKYPVFQQKVADHLLKLEKNIKEHSDE